MKFISLWQPWATFMVQRYTLPDGDRIAKAIETRSWSISYRGKLGIHAAKYKGPKVGDIYDDIVVKTILGVMGYQADGSDLPYGALLGSVEVVDCVPTDLIDELGAREAILGNYEAGRFGWLTDPHQVERFKEPIPYKGSQGFFDVELDAAINKYDHVREAASGPAGDHHCHWPGCEKKVPPAMWGCKAHWKRLPPELRQAIWNEYRAGQEISKRPSRGYVSVAAECQAWIKENHPPIVDPQGKLF